MNYKNILIIIVLSFFAMSCERDEICIDPITPHLVLRFYDNENPDEFKAPNIEVEIIGLSGDPLKFTTDSIGLPLNVNQVSTAYVLTSVTGTERNSDTLTVNYTVEDRFVGRACGYKSVFLNTQFIQTTDAEPWMISLLSNFEQIENEENAHLNIFH